MRRWVWIGLGVAGLVAMIGLAIGAFLLVRLLPLARVWAAPPPATATPTPTVPQGVVILAVEPGGPADRAGLVRGDILLEVDGTPVRTLADVRSVLSRHRPGDTVSVVVQHGDERRTRTVTLGDRDGRAYLGIVVAPEPSPFMPWRWGKLRERLRPPVPGALILSVEPGSPAERAGLQAGDWITAVDGQALGAREELSARIAAHRPGEAIRLTLWRPTEGERDVTVTLGEHPQRPGQAYLGIRYVALGFRWAPRPTPTPIPLGGGA